MEMTVNDVLSRLTITRDQIDKLTGENLQDFKIISPKNIRDEIFDFYKGGTSKGLPLGFHHTDEGFKIRDHELSILTGSNGSGKTMWLSQVCLHRVLNGTKCLIASLEMHPTLTVSRMINQDLRTPDPTVKSVDAFIDKVEDKLFIYRQDGVTTTVDMYAMIEYAHNILGCQVFVIDSLMKMSDIAEDNYDKQKKFIDHLTAYARKYPIHIFVVAHTRKLMDFYAQPTKNDIHGSNHIANLADNILCVWRNRYKEKAFLDGKLTDDEIRNIPDCKVFIQKQRNYIGEDGEPTFNFYYSRKEMRYRDRP